MASIWNLTYKNELRILLTVKRTVTHGSAPTPYYYSPLPGATRSATVLLARKAQALSAICSADVMSLWCVRRPQCAYSKCKRTVATGPGRPPSACREAQSPHCDHHTCLVWFSPADGAPRCRNRVRRGTRYCVNRRSKSLGNLESRDLGRSSLLTELGFTRRWDMPCAGLSRGCK